jgi:hypothetical protein
MDNMGPSWTLRVYHGHLWVHHPDTIGLSWTLESIMATMRLWVHQGHYSYIMDTMSLSWTLCRVYRLSWTLWVHRGRYGFIMDTMGLSWSMDTMGL